ncbi:MAG: hypothetical protein HKP58_03125 [Desulfatitalea sp.]|nr:DUF2345 domain-containing protein [Desulfatitalea sp.]NNJ99384.1 hypothetical protein [Desulfatitalea sp.]
MEKKEPKRVIEDHFEADERCAYPVVGRIARSDNLGEILVTVQGSAPVPARLLSTIDRREVLKKESIGRQVLLLFENGLKQHPIIVGLLENLIEDIVSLEIAPEAQDAKKPVDLQVDNERIVLDAKKEIVLKCGKGSITIKKDGKIVILGTNLISRSRGPHKIKGASVSIN